MWVSLLTQAVYNCSLQYTCMFLWSMLNKKISMNLNCVNNFYTYVQGYYRFKMVFEVNFNFWRFRSEPDLDRHNYSLACDKCRYWVLVQKLQFGLVWVMLKTSSSQSFLVPSVRVSLITLTVLTLFRWCKQLKHVP